MPTGLSFLASVQSVVCVWGMPTSMMLELDAACASKCTLKKQLRYQCTAMSSLPSIIISMLHIIKLRQHCMAEATTEPVKCLIEDRVVAV